jgi:hypothetical protein
MKFGIRYFFIVLVIAYACKAPNEKNVSNHAQNPPATGFDMANSDPAAVELADSIMAAMGGRGNWDRTRFISWNFAGRRNLVWDKQSGRVRIESPGDSSIYLININSNEGRVRIKNKEVTNPDSLKEKLHDAKNIWINDSYWLVMPFKLKDSGVTLKYLGEKRTDSTQYNVLQLTFSDVGATPQNKYLVYVDLTDNLVKEWAYYRDAAQDTANFVLPWDNYRKYGDILLSADRTGGRGPRDVRVDNKLPDNLFTKF